MRVICINNENVEHLISIGDTYDVIQCPLHEGGYGVHGVTNAQNKVCFNQNKFIPLSTIDETELLQDKLETVIN